MSLIHARKVLNISEEYVGTALSTVCAVFIFRALLTNLMKILTPKQEWNTHTWKWKIYRNLKLRESPHIVIKGPVERTLHLKLRVRVKG